MHVKDIRIFMTPSSRYRSYTLSDIVIIDNAAHSFGFQVDNGIPMLPFYHDKQDKEMVHLLYFLNKIADHDGKHV